jgi:hypothetical protein
MLTNLHLAKLLADELNLHATRKGVWEGECPYCHPEYYTVNAFTMRLTGGDIRFTCDICPMLSGENRNAGPSEAKHRLALLRNKIGSDAPSAVPHTRSVRALPAPSVVPHTHHGRLPTPTVSSAVGVGGLTLAYASAERPRRLSLVPAQTRIHLVYNADAPV